MITLIELGRKVAEIEAKYTDKSDFRVSISMGDDYIPKYSIYHSAKGKSVDTGYGSTSIKELLLKFELAMHSNYRFKDDKTVEDIILEP